MHPSVPHHFQRILLRHLCCSSALKGQKMEATYQLETWLQGVVGWSVVGENLLGRYPEKFYKQILGHLMRNFRAKMNGLSTPNSSNLKALIVSLQTIQRNQWLISVFNLSILRQRQVHSVSSRPASSELHRETLTLKTK